LNFSKWQTMSHSVVSSTLHHDPGTDCYFHKINATMTPSPKQNKKNQNKQTNKQTVKTKKQYMVMEQRSFGHKIRFYRSYFPSLVQSSMKITTCTVNVFFSFFPCDIFFEICTFVSWIHQVLVSYPGLVNISKAHNI
jgi:hypothetical protein